MESQEKDLAMAVKVTKDNDFIYYTNERGKYHREDGPAVQYFKEGILIYECWYIDGFCHREDGPAQEWIDRGKAYWFNGKQYSFEEWEQVVKFKAFI